MPAGKQAVSEEAARPLGVAAARGVGILVSRTLLLQLLTAGVTLVLARLLSPADYGLFALATAVQSLAQVASGVGLSAALIREPGDPAPDQQAAVSGFLLAIGLGFAVAAAAVAFLAAPALGAESESLAVIAVTAAAVPIYALRTVPMVLLERHLRFGRVALVETVETLSFNAFALAAAIAGLGAFSLAGAVPVAAAGGLLTVRLLQRPGPGLSLDLDPVRPLAHFGLRASILKTASLVRGLLFVTLVAALGGTATAGFYGMATRLFAFPAALASAVQRVAFPALSRSDEERPRRAMRAAGLSAVLASLALALLAGASHSLVTVLLGERWLPTVDLMLASAPGVLLGASATPAMVGLALAQGRPRGPIVAIVLSAATMAGACLALVPPLGATGVGIAITAGAVVNLVVLGWHAEAAMRQAARPLSLALLIGGVAAACGYLVALPETGVGLALRLLLVAAIWTGLALWLMRPTLLEALRLAWPIVPPRLRRLSPWRP